MNYLTISLASVGLFRLSQQHCQSLTISMPKFAQVPRRNSQCYAVNMYGSPFYETKGPASLPFFFFRMPSLC